MFILNDSDSIALGEICSTLKKFVRFGLGVNPTLQQLEIMKAIDDGAKRVAVKSGHGTGKSALVSWIALWTMFRKDDAKIPITAPSSPQLLSTLMPEIKKWASALPKELRGLLDFKSDEINCDNNGNKLIMRTARKETPEALQGYHSKNLTYLIDEGSGVCNDVFEVIEGALTGKDNMVIMVGNPTRTSGYFYDAFHKNKDLWKTFTLNAEQSPNVSKEAIDRAKKMYGEYSDAYRVRVLGEFPRASSDALFSVEDLEEALNRVVDSGVGDEIWGLDVAEFGDDCSALCKRSGFKIRPILTYRNLDSEGLADVIHLEYKKSQVKPKGIYVDTIGVGAGVWSILLRRGLPVIRADVRRTSFSEQTFNKRAEMYLRLKEVIGFLDLPRDDELFGDLSAIAYKFDNKANTQIVPKSEIKKRLGRSPDKSDSLALTFYDLEFEDSSSTDDDIALSLFNDGILW